MIRLLAASAALLAPVGLLAATPAPAHAGQVGVTVGIEGAGAVRVVEGSLEDLAPSTCTRYDNQDHRVTVWCGRFRNEEPFEAWVWLRPTPSPMPEGEWQFSRWSGCDTTRVTDGVTECAVHSGAFGSVERSPVAHFRDVVAPGVTLSATQVLDDDRTFQFGFTATEGNTECRLEGETTFAPCASPVRRAVPEGRHAFEVRAVDRSGNVGAAETEVVSVDTAITFGPSAVSRNPTAVLGLSTGAGQKFWCSLDNAPFTVCGDGPRRNVVLEYLDEGFHRFRAYAASGDWRDPVPAEWRWSVDSIGPTTPTELHAEVQGDRATFTFSNPEATSFRCRVDSPGVTGMWGACASPAVLEGLEEGEHQIQVQGLDAAGNIETPGVAHQWTVDTIAPTTTLTAATSYDTAQLTFSAPDATTFECRLAGPGRTPAWVACTSPTAYTGLQAGEHVFEVRARDAAGNVESPPVTHRWTATAQPQPSPGPGTTPEPTTEPTTGPATEPVPTTAPLPTSVPVPATGKVTSSTTARWKFAPGRRGKVLVKVVAAVVPTGRIVVRDKGKVIARVRLTSAQHGKVVVRLPRLRPGRHTLVVAYLGSTRVAASRSQAVRKPVR